ncbi:hypothetical protein PanWU01x14_020900, partial [Parasponia andersonii]
HGRDPCVPSSPCARLAHGPCSARAWGCCVQRALCARPTPLVHTALPCVITRRPSPIPPVALLFHRPFGR